MTEDDLWETVQVGLEIDEPDESERKKMAKEAVEKALSNANIIEDYHIVEKPVITLEEEVEAE